MILFYCIHKYIYHHLKTESKIEIKIRIFREACMFGDVELCEYIMDNGCSPCCINGIGKS